MYLKKSLSRKFVLLFILSTLLPSGLLNVHSAVAQENLTPPQEQPGSIDIEFDEHNRYNPFQPGKKPRAKWEVDINFIGEHIDAKWIVHIEQEERDRQWILIDEYIMHLECQKQGNVEIESDVATFNPKTRDYISCDLPSYRVAVEQLLGTKLDVHCDCIDPWLSFAHHVTPNKQRAYPVISLNTVENSSAVFEATIQRQGRRRAYVETWMSGWDYPEKSKAFNTRRPQTFWSGSNLIRFIETLSERHDLDPTLWTAFWTSTELDAYLNQFDLASENMWLSWVESLGRKQSIADAQDMTMYTDEMTLYIGYNPKTRQYYRGNMTNIGVDPGCSGLGGRRWRP